MGWAPLMYGVSYDLFQVESLTTQLQTGQSMTEKQRSTTPHTPETYSFKNYLAYVIYPPLYIAGPIMTFNNFLWQVRSTCGLGVHVSHTSVAPKTNTSEYRVHTQIPLPFHSMHSYYGIHTALHVRCRNKRHPSVGGSNCCGIELNWVVELDGRMVEGMLNI